MLTTGQERSALMVAFHFPPLLGSSGIQRTLGFTRHLPSEGWKPIVLAPQDRAYSKIDERQMCLIPSKLTVERALCLDTARHLSIGGRYVDRMAVPDRWVSWVPWALLKGLRIIRRDRPSVVWSTYPIATSLIIGRNLAKRGKLPWVVDFRDPMVEQDPETGAFVPSQPLILDSRLKIEARCVEQASALIFCTDAARQICLDRYPTLSREKCHVISNGYEEWSFLEAEKLIGGQEKSPKPEVTTLLHSGTIYPTPDRDPSPFLDAVSELKAEGSLSASTVRIRFRASGHDDYLTRLVETRGIDDIVELLPPLPYLDALAEMMTVDGLLIFQGHTSNPAIPAKIYECFRARTPILGLLDPSGSTAGLMKSVDAGPIAPITSSSSIKDTLVRFVLDITRLRARVISSAKLSRFSRGALTKQLCAILDSVS